MKGRKDDGNRNTREDEELFGQCESRSPGEGNDGEGSAQARGMETTTIVHRTHTKCKMGPKCWLNYRPCEFQLNKLCANVVIENLPEKPHNII